MPAKAEGITAQSLQLFQHGLDLVPALGQNAVSGQKQLKLELFAVNGHGAPHIRIFASIFGSGLIVTTINTVVLRYFTLPAWAGRAFWILWTPRALEELIVCIIQAYFIAILYDVYMTRFQDRL